MSELENNSLENVHVIHKSLVVLLVKGFIAWALIAIVYLAGAMFISRSTDLLNSSVMLQNVANFWPSITVSLIVLFLYGLLTLFITLDWIYTYYILDSKAVVTSKGILFSKEGRYDMAGIESIVVDQGLIGKLFGFGTLILFNPILERELKLRSIPDPYMEARFVQRMHPNPEILHLIPKSK